LLATRQMRFGVGDFGVLGFLAEPGEPLFPEGPDAALADLDRGAHEVGASLRVPAAECEAEPPTRALRHLAANIAHMWSEGSRVSVGTSIQRIDPDAYIIEATADELGDGVLLGRYPRCRGSLELGRDGSVSRVHALILRRGGRCLLIDCASTNGTRLEPSQGESLLLGQGDRVRSIEPGDDILLGEVRLRFTIVD